MGERAFTPTPLKYTTVNPPTPTITVGWHRHTPPLAERNSSYIANVVPKVFGKIENTANDFDPRSNSYVAN